jgi:serine/threonine protein phosphatase PrpC
MNPEEAQEYLRLSVATIDAVTKDNISGSTFTGVIVTQDGNLVTAHLGDSPASAIIIGKDGDLKHVERLIVDHRPAESETEKEGRSLSGRIFYDQRGRRQADDYDISINLTHALGNAAFGDVLSHTPEVAFHDMQKLLQEGDRLLLLVTSDGAHNETRSITHQTHAPTIASGLMRNWSLADISDQIAANSRLIRDNVTVTLLEVERGKGAVIAIFDGHGGSETSDQAQRIFLNLTERFAQQDKPASIEALASTVALEERL